MSEEARKTSLWTLFITFAKIGVMTFGGGYAMLPLLEREIVTNHGWSTADEMLDYYAIGQCTPGIIAVNVSTFIGYKTRGILGGIVSTFGIVFPSLLIIIGLASVLKVFEDNIYVVKAFSGIRVAVCALMVSAVIKLTRSAVSNIATGIIAVCSLLVQLFLNVSPVLIVITSALVGVIVFFGGRRRKTSNGDSEASAAVSGAKGAKSVEGEGKV